MEVYDINTIYNRYKECINSCYSKLKDEVEQIINQKQLYSIMNDAKWLKLQTAILTIPEFEPDYCVQLLTDEIEYSPVTGEAPTYSWVGNSYMKIMNIVRRHFLTLNGWLFGL